MKNWKYIVLGAAAALSIGFATPASAAHDHYLVTPGTCVPDIARGQTAISDATRGGYHQFHDRVHFGVPGEGDTADPTDGAFQNPNNPVEVYKVTATSSCPAE
ncbi:MAG: hypothetical protein M3506_07030 [Chloroflexota bacterium]|nr:hypothetical protein [Chloroflexota bacterium]